VLAGIHLLTSNTVASADYLQTVAHGMGIHFIGRGLFVLGSLDYAEDTAANLLKRIAERLEREATADLEAPVAEIWASSRYRKAVSRRPQSTRHGE